LITAAADMALQYLQHQGEIDSGLATEALRVTAIHGDDSIARQYLKAYRESDDTNFKTKLLGSMYFTDPASIKLILEFSQSDLVNSGDSITPIYYLFYANKVHSQLYAWLDENFDAVVAKLPSVRRPGLPLTTGGSCNADNLDLTLAFYKDRDEMFESALAKSEEDSRKCLSLKNREQKALQNFFASYRDKEKA
jgi:hypothetical protein